MNDTCMHEYVDCAEKYDVCRECDAKWVCPSFEADCE